MSTLTRQYLGQQLQAKLGDPLRVPARFAPGLSLKVGQLLAQITATAVNEVQTLSQSSGTATGGTFKLTFYGLTTDPIAYNATAAQVQAALEKMLASIGLTGSVACAGGALPGTPITITFQNLLGGIDVPAITVDGAALTGTNPVYAVATTTPGVNGGRWVAYDGTLVAPPASAPSVSQQAGGSLPQLSSYLAQFTWVTAAGESTPSPAASIVLTSTNQTIRFAAVSAPTGATAGRFYLNGVRVGSASVSGGNLPQTDITDMTGSTAGLPGLPAVNNAFLNSDGRQVARGALELPIVSDVLGRVAVGQAFPSEGSQFKQAEPVVLIRGAFRLGDLTGLTVRALEDLKGRVLSGKADLTDLEALVQIG